MSSHAGLERKKRLRAEQQEPSRDNTDSAPLMSTQHVPAGELQNAGTEHPALEQAPAIGGHHLSKIAIQSPDAPVSDGPVFIQPSVLSPGDGPRLPMQRQEDLGAQIASRLGKGTSLPLGVRQQLEGGLGASLSGVRVHADSEADRLARSVQAVAFTTGSDIFFRQGAYRPETPEGLHLLTHEATHTIQQSQGPVAGTPDPRGVSISDPGDRFEQAAEAAAQRALESPSIQRMGTEQAVQRWTSAGSRQPVPIQRWPQIKPGVKIPWNNTRNIKTLSSGQPVFFFYDDTNKPIVVKSEKTPIGMTQLNAFLHRQIHGHKSVWGEQVTTGERQTVIDLLNDSSKLDDASWTNLGNTKFVGNMLKDGLISPGTPKEMARETHQWRLKNDTSLDRFHVMDFAEGESFGNLARPEGAPEGYKSARSLFADHEYMYKLGLISAADLFMGNGDRVLGGNMGNWRTNKNDAISLIDNLDDKALDMWKKGNADKKDTDSGWDDALKMLAPSELHTTALKCTLGLAQIGDAERGGGDTKFGQELLVAAFDQLPPKWQAQRQKDGSMRKTLAEARKAVSDKEKTAADQLVADMVQQLERGLADGRKRIIKLYSTGKKKKTGRAAKRGAKYAQGVDTADLGGQNLDYWELLKARARYLAKLK